MKSTTEVTGQTTSSRGFFHFLGGKHLSFVPTLENVFGAIAGGSRSSSFEDRLMRRAANDAAQR